MSSSHDESEQHPSQDLTPASHAGEQPAHHRILGTFRKGQKKRKTAAYQHDPASVSPGQVSTARSSKPNFLSRLPSMSDMRKVLKRHGSKRERRGTDTCIERDLPSKSQKNHQPSHATIFSPTTSHGDSHKLVKSHWHPGTSLDQFAKLAGWSSELVESAIPILDECGTWTYLSRKQGGPLLFLD